MSEDLISLLALLESYLQMKSLDGKAERQFLRARLTEMVPIIRKKTSDVMATIADQTHRRNFTDEDYIYR